MQQAESSCPQAGISPAAVDLKAPWYAGSWLVALSGKALDGTTKSEGF